MKRYASVVSPIALLVLLGLVLLAVSTGQSVDAQGDGPRTPPTEKSPWGPPVGEPPTGKPLPVAPLYIPEAMRRANASITSDDFSSCILDTELWSFVNPFGDGSQQVTGTTLEITVPTGLKHAAWVDGNDTVRVMQAADDTDFEIEVKFESGVSEGFQMQGILVQGDPPDEVDPQNFLRFEFYSNGLQTFGFSAILQPGVTVEFSSTKTYDMPLYDNNTSPLWMRVRRQGDRWSMLHSADGIQWQGAAAFDHPLEVQSVGTFGGNGGGKTPAHVAKVDYFFNTASPIDPEDGSGDPLTITPSPPGSGTVTQDPPGPTYGCDQEVTLTPNPAPGYQFDRWGGPDGGDVVQQAGEWVITMDGPKEVTAFFVQGGYTLEMLQPLGQGQVTPDVGVYTYQEDEVVTLVAVPDSGWDFDGWYEADGQTPHPDVANDKLATTTLAMDGDKEIRARFVGEPTEWWIYVPLAVNSY